MEYKIGAKIKKLRKARKLTLQDYPENAFGIQKFAGRPTNYGTIPVGYVPGGGEKYPIDPLAEKPSYTSVRNAYKP